jgi:hypothetical protein
MKPRKPTSNKPNLRDKLSENFLRFFTSDFEDNGIAAIEALRQKSPEKYSEIAARLITATEPKPDGFNECQSMEDLGRKLLQSIGLNDPTEDQIEAAVEANNALIASLEAIRDRAHN